MVLPTPLTLRRSAIPYRLLLALEVLLDHVFGLEAPVLAIFELAAVHEPPHYPGHELELVAALLQARKDLLAPLLAAVPFRVQAEPEQDLKALHLRRILKIVEDLEQGLAAPLLRLCHIQRGLLQSDCQALPQIELVEADRLSLAAELLDEVECELLWELGVLQ